MGPAVLITIGVLFLLAQATQMYWLDWGHTWPALLIVIGLVQFLQFSASAAGHIPPGYMPAPPGQPVAPPVGYPQQGPVVTPPPAPASANLPAVQQYNPDYRPEDPGVHNG